MMEFDEATQPPYGTQLPDRVARLFSSDQAWDHGISIWPDSGEAFDQLVRRAAQSDVPEEALLLLACGLPEHHVIEWAYLCCKDIQGAFTPMDSELLERVKRWLSDREGVLRESLLIECMWQLDRRPAVLLGLAVGFRGGVLAPQWTVPIPPQFTAICANEAVLTSLALVEPQDRDEHIQRFLSLAEPYVTRMVAIG